MDKATLLKCINIVRDEIGIARGELAHGPSSELTVATGALKMVKTRLMKLLDEEGAQRREPNKERLFGPI